MLNSLHPAEVGQKISNCEEGNDACRVAFVCDSDSGRRVYLPTGSEIEFDEQPYYRAGGTIKLLRLKKAVLLAKPGPVYGWILKFASGEAIEPKDFPRGQTATVLSIPDRKGVSGLGPEIEKMLFGS